MTQLAEGMRELNIYSMLLRLLLAVVMGGLIGLEREAKRRPAGFRTYMLVCLGAAVTVLLGQYFDQMAITLWADRPGGAVRSDVSRMAAQVINGVGFLGAGTVIVTSRQEIKGVTTAAGLWASACLGLAIGAGFYESVVIAVVLMLVCMRLFFRMERAIMQTARNMNIYVVMEGVECIGLLLGLVRGQGIRIFQVELDRRSESEPRRTAAVFSIGLPRRRSHAEVLAMLSAAEGIMSIEEL